MLTNRDQAELITLRRDLHRWPEVSGQEVVTASRMADVLRGAGGEVITGLGGHGVAGVWRGPEPGPTVMFRAELDALPIREAEGPDWRSRHEGVAHLCGHDGHMTILAGLARVLARRPPLKGRVILLLQPAEEDGSGAAAVLADPRFSALAPDWAFAVHNMPQVPFGQAWLAPGPANCASVGLAIRLTGATAHAATPETGRSPAPAVARLMQALPRLGRVLADADGTPLAGFRLVTLTHAQMGEPAFGIAPAEAVLMATVRAIDDPGLDDLVTAVEAMAREAAGADGLDCAITRHDHFAACRNEPEAVRLLARGLAAAGITSLAQGLPLRASEDFGRFGAAGHIATGTAQAGERPATAAGDPAQGARAAMAFVGAGGGPAVHSENYDFNEALIAPCVTAFEHVMRALLGPR